MVPAIVVLATNWTLTGGTNLNMKIEIKLAWTPLSYLDTWFAGVTDVMTSETAVDGAIFLELDKTNLRNKTLRDFA